MTIATSDRAGQLVPGNPHKRVKPMRARPNTLNTDALSKLTKPFKIPMKQSLQPARKAKRQVNYAEDTEGIGNDSQGIRQPLSDIRPRLNALNPRLFKPVESKPFICKHKAKSLNPPPPLGTRRKPVIVPRPLHDPTGEYAIVLYDPTVDDSIIAQIEKNDLDSEAYMNELKEAEEKAKQEAEAQKQREKKYHNQHKSLKDILGISDSKKKVVHPNVPVVIDPKLAKILRPHQVQGVKFLYRCVSGLVDKRANGCIMADEMGLGKTLQCLTLMWTLLRQSPQGKPTIQKCIIVCPSSLVRNWANEIVKWLGEGVLTPLAMDGKNKEIAFSIRQWAQAAGRQIVRPVLIISYETLRRNVEELKGTEIGLLLCDEGHRLKNGDSLTFTALDSLNVKRRVILSGTPIQNDLSEYFSLLNFANPGLLGSRTEFRKNFELEILRGRDADASEEEIKKGEEKLAELSTIVSRFIIRRTNDILSKYLPVKYEHVVFVNLSPFQRSVYQHFITSPEIKKLLKGVGSQPLKAIGLLKKLCNHPDLLNLPEDIEGSERFIPDDYVSSNQSHGRSREFQSWHSGKFSILGRMLATIRHETDDKIVIISNYTQTLDLVERMCRSNHYGCLRLDGTMNINKRQKLVDRFNDPENPDIFVFLLSSKAGGCGLNLIGANRLILLDPDWNPAADQQALARVWRDGQKKDCFIYRFIATGTIEEKIFQRQSMKLSLSSCVVDEAQDVERLYSTENLRQLFEFNPDTLCDTHDTYKCKRCQTAGGRVKSDLMLYGDATTWNHFENKHLRDLEDLLLRNEAGNSDISYLFEYISH